MFFFLLGFFLVTAIAWIVFSLISLVWEIICEIISMFFDGL